MASYEEIKEAIAANDYVTAKALFDETTDRGLRNRLSGERRPVRALPMDALPHSR